MSELNSDKQASEVPWNGEDSEWEYEYSGTEEEASQNQPSLESSHWSDFDRLSMLSQTSLSHKRSIALVGSPRMPGEPQPEIPRHQTHLMTAAKKVLAFRRSHHPETTACKSWSSLPVTLSLPTETASTNALGPCLLARISYSLRLNHQHLSQRCYRTKIST